MQQDTAGLILISFAIWALVIFVWVEGIIDRKRIKQRNLARKLNCIGCSPGAVGVIMLDAKDVSKETLCDSCWLRWHRIAALEKELDNGKP